MTPKELIAAYNAKKFRESPLNPNEVKEALLDFQSNSTLARRLWLAVFVFLNVAGGPKAVLIYQDRGQLYYVSISATRDQLGTIFSRLGAIVKDESESHLSRNSDFLVTGLDPLAARPRVTLLSLPPEK